MLTRSQCEWAKSHDWWLATDYKAGEVIVEEVATHSDLDRAVAYFLGTPGARLLEVKDDHVLTVAMKTFGDFKTLRDWAGY